MNCFLFYDVLVRGVTKRSNVRRLSKCHHQCLTINDQAAGLIVAEVCTCCVSMFANTALLVECRLPQVVAKDSGTVMSSCWRMFSRFTSRPAL